MWDSIYYNSQHLYKQKALDVCVRITKRDGSTKEFTGSDFTDVPVIKSDAGTSGKFPIGIIAGSSCTFKVKEASVPEDYDYENCIIRAGFMYSSAFVPRYTGIVVEVTIKNGEVEFESVDMSDRLNVKCGDVYFHSNSGNNFYVLSWYSLYKKICTITSPNRSYSNQSTNKLTTAFNRLVSAGFTDGVGASAVEFSHESASTPANDAVIVLIKDRDENRSMREIASELVAALCCNAYFDSTGAFQLAHVGKDINPKTGYDGGSFDEFIEAIGGDPEYEDGDELAEKGGLMEPTIFSDGYYETSFNASSGGSVTEIPYGVAQHWLNFTKDRNEMAVDGVVTQHITIDSLYDSVNPGVFEEVTETESNTYVSTEGQEGTDKIIILNRFNIVPLWNFNSAAERIEYHNATLHTALENLLIGTIYTRFDGSHIQNLTFDQFDPVSLYDEKGMESKSFLTYVEHSLAGETKLRCETVSQKEARADYMDWLRENPIWDTGAFIFKKG